MNNKKCEQQCWFIRRWKCCKWYKNCNWCNFCEFIFCDLDEFRYWYKEKCHWYKYCNWCKYCELVCKLFRMMIFDMMMKFRIVRKLRKTTFVCKNFQSFFFMRICSIFCCNKNFARFLIRRIFFACSAKRRSLTKRICSICCFARFLTKRTSCSATYWWYCFEKKHFEHTFACFSLKFALYDHLSTNTKNLHCWYSTTRRFFICVSFVMYSWAFFICDIVKYLYDQWFVMKMIIYFDVENMMWRLRKIRK